MKKTKRPKRLARFGRAGLVALAIASIAGGALWWWVQRDDQVATRSVTAQNESSPQPGPPKTNANAPIRVIMSGDELPHSAITQEAKQSGGYDYTPFFREVKPVFDRADIRFCNQEAVSAGEAYGITGYPAFNAPKEFARGLSAVGCNVISLANNHMYDKGQVGIDETVALWRSLKPLALAGANTAEADQSKVSYFEVRGVKFAFVAYTEISNRSGFAPYSLNMLDDALVTRQLQEARKQADIVLVSVHWGTEYVDQPNAAQKQWAEKFAGLGADVVMGTGPHVLQPVQTLPRAGGGQTIVWYSLGNLLSAQLDTPSLIGGFGVIEVDPATKQVVLKGFLPTYMHYEWSAEEKAREELLARRNFQIFPLDKAAEPMSRSQAGTTVEAQTKRLEQLLSATVQVPLLTTEQYLAR